MKKKQLRFDDFDDLVEYDLDEEELRYKKRKDFNHYLSRVCLNPPTKFPCKYYGAVFDNLEEYNDFMEAKRERASRRQKTVKAHYRDILYNKDEDSDSDSDEGK